MNVSRLVERKPVASYCDRNDGNDYVDFKELDLQGQSAYNPAVAGLAEFIWKHGPGIEGAEAISLALTSSTDRHFVATDGYGLHTGRVYGYAAVTSIAELVYVPTLLSRDGTLTGAYQRTMGALLHAALESEIEADRPLIVEIGDAQNKSFFTEAGMNVHGGSLETMAQAESLAAIYDALRMTYDLHSEI